MSVPWRLGLLLVLSAFLSSPALAFDLQQVNEAEPGTGNSSKASAGKLDPLVTKVEILLDRAHFSPGEIDGKPGENVQKALTAFAAAHGTAWQGHWTPELWQALTKGAPQDLFSRYTTTDADMDGPFLQKVPAKMEDMKDLPGLYYTGVREALAERFHVSEQMLVALNPDAKFQTAGETLVMPAVADNALARKVARVVVDKSAQTVEALDSNKDVLAFYPATVGSEEKPAPSGRLRVTIIKEHPIYHYNPKYHFKGVKTEKPFAIKPGPNNPVGSVWIGLTGEGYGIHGTPEPEKVSKTASHGCVRLTNWDALRLAGALHKGVPVEFVEGRPDTSKQGRTKPVRETIGWR
jgi:lipoprotein-anchoring transpeptidase ErfK/SrfK